MAISLTADGLDLDYRTEPLTGASGTFPIGTVVSVKDFAEGNIKDVPGTWAKLDTMGSAVATVVGAALAIRVL